MASRKAKWFGAILAITTLGASARAELAPVNVDQFFVEPNEKLTLLWSGGKGSSLPYQITGYLGEKIASGQAAVDSKGQVRVDVKLPAGFYEIQFTDQKQTFGIDAIAPFDGKADSFFAIDSALSSRVRHNGDQVQYGDFKAVRHGLIGILRRSGISMSRERLRWTGVNPAEGQWNFNGLPRNNDDLRQAYADNGVKVLDMFQEAPPYVGRAGPDSLLPKNLVKTAAAWEHIADRWEEAWGALEVWNEPNRGTLPADQYVPLVKAVAYTLKHRSKPILIGDASMGAASEFSGQAARNGLLQCIDFYNFHTYAWAPKIQKNVQRYRDWLATTNRPNIPLWLTESGRPWSRGTARPKLAQDQSSALDITMKAIESRACGVERYFPFIYVYYEENSFNYGMMGRYATPLRSFAAYAQAVRMLSNKAYLGDWPHDKKLIARARVFGDANQAIVVLYTGEAKKGASVELSLNAAKAYGIDGRELSLKEAGRIPIPDGLTYVVLKPHTSLSAVKTDTVAMRLYEIAGKKTPPPEPSPIVLQALVSGQKGIRPSVEGYWWNPSDMKGTMHYQIRINNLDDRAHTVTLQSSHGSGLEKQAISALGAQSRQVGPHSFVDVPWTLKMTPQLAEASPTVIQVQAKSSDAPATTGVVFRLLPELSLEQLLSRHGPAVQLPIGKTKHWKPNFAKHTKWKMSSPDGKGWRLDVDFPPEVRNRWAYPRFYLPKGMKLSKGYKGFVIRERCVKPGAVRMFIWTKTPKEPRKAYITNNEIIPADDQWHAVFIPFSGFRHFGPADSTGALADTELHPEQITAISLGLHSDSNSPINTVEVSDVWIVH